MAGLRQHVKARELVDEQRAHDVEQGRLVVIELLA